MSAKVIIHPRFYAATKEPPIQEELEALRARNKASEKHEDVIPLKPREQNKFAAYVYQKGELRAIFAVALCTDTTGQLVQIVIKQENFKDRGPEYVPTKVDHEGAIEDIDADLEKALSPSASKTVLERDRSVELGHAQSLTEHFFQFLDDRISDDSGIKVTGAPIASAAITESKSNYPENTNIYTISKDRFIAFIVAIKAVNKSFEWPEELVGYDADVAVLPIVDDGYAL